MNDHKEVLEHVLQQLRLGRARISGRWRRNQHWKRLTLGQRLTLGDV